MFQNRCKILVIIVTLCVCFTAGGVWGLNQVLCHRNSSFFSRFETASQEFWGVDSWRNKYINFNPKEGRNGVPVWFTDGKHLTASMTQLLLILGGILFGFSIKDTKEYLSVLLCSILLFLSYSSGNYLIWDIYFN